MGKVRNNIIIDTIFAEHRPNIVVNLAAQAGVRYSITNPDVYIVQEVDNVGVRPQRCQLKLF